MDYQYFLTNNGIAYTGDESKDLKKCTCQDTPVFGNRRFTLPNNYDDGSIYRNLNTDFSGADNINSRQDLSNAQDPSLVQYSDCDNKGWMDNYMPNRQANPDQNSQIDPEFYNIMNTAFSNYSSNANNAETDNTGMTGSSWSTEVYLPPYESTACPYNYDPKILSGLTPEAYYTTDNTGMTGSSWSTEVCLPPYESTASPYNYDPANTLAPIVSETYYPGMTTPLYTTTEVTTSTDTPQTSTNNPEITIDGKIGNFSQSHMEGDCWLLAQIKATANTIQGAEDIKNSISQESNGSVDITLKGTGEKFTFTPEEIKDAESRLSTGDDDVRVIELAVEKHRENLVKNGEDRIDSKDVLGGGPYCEAGQLLTGRTPEVPVLKERGNGLDKIENGNGKYSGTAAFYFNCTSDEAENKKVTEKFKNIGIIPEHEYTIKNANKDNVTLTNPWDTSKDITVAREEFLRYTCQMAIYS